MHYTGYALAAFVLVVVTLTAPEFRYHWRRWCLWRRWREHLRDAARNDYEE